MKTYRQICSIILIACVCMGTGTSGGEDGHRVFKSIDGRRIIGKLTGYNPDRQLATIARKDGREFQVLLNLFSERDQRYIREQSAVMDFMHSIRIEPRLLKYSAAGRYDQTRCKNAQVRALGYTISMNNPSPTRFEELKIEYCLFYRQGQRHDTGIEFRHGVQFGRREFGSMVPGAGHILETEKVLIYETDTACTLFGSDNRSQGGVDGIWLRVTAMTPTGDRVLREFQSPSLTNNFHNWVTASVPVGLNSPPLTITQF